MRLLEWPEEHAVQHIRLAENASLIEDVQSEENIEKKIVGKERYRPGETCEL